MSKWLLTFWRYGGDDTLLFDNEHDAKMVYQWFQGSSASDGESLVEIPEVVDQPNTKEQNIAFRKAWDKRVEDGWAKNGRD